VSSTAFLNTKTILLTFFTLAGNNEDYALAESIPLELDYSVEYPEVDFRKTSFPARYIYEVLLPELVTKHAPDMYYHLGSPYSGSGKRSDDRKHGDIHQWNVWHVSLITYAAVCFRA